MPKGQWGRTTRHDDVWVLDYCGWEGMHCRVEVPGQATRTFPRPPGIWHLYGPGVAYSERFDQPELRLEDMWILFEMPQPVAPLDECRFAAIDDAEGIIVEHVRQICRRCDSGLPGMDLAAHGQLILVLGEIIAAARSGRTGTPDDPWLVRSLETAGSATEHSLLQQVDEAVSRRLTSPPSLNELAEQLGMSVSSLVHRFKRETGMTIVQRIRWLRIQRAKQLLARPGATVKSVAYALGFSSPFYFSSVFAKTAGVTAQAYAQAYQARLPGQASRSS